MSKRRILQLAAGVLLLIGVFFAYSAASAAARVDAEKGRLQKTVAELDRARASEKKSSDATRGAAHNELLLAASSVSAITDAIKVDRSNRNTYGLIALVLLASAAGLFLFGRRKPGVASS